MYILYLHHLHTLTLDPTLIYTLFLHLGGPSHLLHFFIEHLLEVLVAPHQPGENISVAEEGLVGVVRGAKDAHVGADRTTVDAILGDATSRGCMGEGGRDECACVCVF